MHGTHMVVIVKSTQQLNSVELSRVELSTITCTTSSSSSSSCSCCCSSCCKKIQFYLLFVRIVLGTNKIETR